MKFFDATSSFFSKLFFTSQASLFLNEKKLNALRQLFRQDLCWKKIDE